MNAIFARKSIRSYTDQPVSQEDLHDLLHAGMSAPTAMNDRPWQFILVTDSKVLSALVMDPYTQALNSAQAAIVVCGDTAKDFNGAGFNVIDCSAAAENILIEAADKGLGSVWYAAYPMENRVAHIREVLSLPENIVPYAVLPIGWPEKKPEPTDRYDAAMVHLNRW